jgi:acyl-CoA synthetase (NDP forming)
MSSVRDPGSAVAAPASFDALFDPRSVVVVGVSRREGAVGHRALSALRKQGFAGEVFGVHPELDEVAGFPCVASLSLVPGSPDVAIVLRPPLETIAAVRTAGEQGIGWVVAGGGGFEGDPELVAELARAAADAGVRLVGPNTEGLWHLPSSLIASFGSVATNDVLYDGAAAVVSQSGGVGAAMARMLLATGLGCRTFVGTGNELNVSVTDVLEHLVLAGRHDLLVVYLEAVDDLARFRDIVATAVQDGTVVAVMKVGRSAAGAEAAASHSGRMAGDDALYRSAIAEAGGALIDSLADLAGLARALRVGRPARDGGLAVIAVSGGTRAMAVDAIEESRHVRLARFSPETESRIAGVLPDYATSANPVDVTGAVLNDHAILDGAVRAACEDPDVSGVLVQLGNTQLSGLPRWVATGDVDFGEVPVWVAGLAHPELEGAVRDVPSLPEPGVAIRAIDALSGRPRDEGVATVGREVVASVARPATFLEAVPLLRDAGIGVPVSVVVGPDGSVDALPSTPCFAKTANLQVHHKVAAGGFVAGVATHEEAAAAAEAIRQRLGRQADPVVLQEALAFETEVLVAVHRAGNDRFVVIGAGGSATETERDIAVCLLPATPGAVLRALRSTSLARRLAAEQQQVVCDAVAGLVDLHAALQCAELEINPLVVVDGEHPVALDLLIV